MKTLQAISGITALICMIFIHIVLEKLAGNLFLLAIISTLVFLYVSHEIGLGKQDREEANRG